LKPMMTVMPSEVQNTALIARLRQFGVIATGSNRLSDADLLLIDQAQKALYLRQAIENRKVLIARDVLLYGKTTVASADFPMYEVNYERNASCNFSPLVKWGQVVATPVKDIQSMIDLSVEHSGTSPIMTTNIIIVYNALIKDRELKEKIIAPYASINVTLTPTLHQADKPQFRGTADNMEIWTYAAQHNMGGDIERI